MDTARTQGARLTVVGAGGNIGSHLVAHLARMPAVSGVTLIDRDRYESGNLASQDITPRDVGRPKARVQAERLKRIRPDLQVRAICDTVERVPLGLLRADVVLACLDSLVSRQWVNQAAWRLGCCWIDAGVRASGMLARVDVYAPAPDSACMECGWDHNDYALLEQVFPCAGGLENAPTPTNAPSSLGALAASIQAIECAKAVEGRWDLLASGRQVMVDAAHHRHYVTTFPRNARCLFDHEIWRVRKLNARPAELSVEQALELGNGRGPRALRFDWNKFVRRLACTSCGKARPVLRLGGRLAPADTRCDCGGAMAAPGNGALDELRAEDLSPRELRQSLARLGLRPGDILTVRSSRREQHYELAGDDTSCAH